MPKRVVFFNAFHNGDIHVSRGFVRQIINKAHQIDPTIQFAYGHRCATDLLSDIPNLSHDPRALNIVNGEHKNLVTSGDSIYINTWYGQQNFKYMNRHGVTMDTVYAALNDSCQDVFHFSLADISNDPGVFYPTIDYRTYHITNAKSWLDNHPGKKIFISNGMTLSGQAHNFAMAPLVENLARKHADKTFILSNIEAGISASNVFFSQHIISKGSNDLNENAFLSEHCDTIIGRASGAFTFALTRNNVLKRSCRMLCFSNLVPQKEGKFWLADLLQDKISYSSPIHTTNESNPSVIQNLMESYL